MMLYGFAAGNGVVIIPKGTTPNTIAGVMKKYLKSLPEPLLTFKYAASHEPLLRTTRLFPASLRPTLPKCPTCQCRE
jgi:hypothetical protein